MNMIHLSETERERLIDAEWEELSLIHIFVQLSFTKEGTEKFAAATKAALAAK